METSVGIDILLLEEMDEGMASIAHTPPKMDRSRTRSEEERRGLSYRTKNTHKTSHCKHVELCPLRFIGISDPKSTLKVLSLNNFTTYLHIYFLRAFISRRN